MGQIGGGVIVVKAAVLPEQPSRGHGSSADNRVAKKTCFGVNADRDGAWFLLGVGGGTWLCAEH